MVQTGDNDESPGKCVFNQYNAFNLRSNNSEYVHLNFAFAFQNTLLLI